MFVGPTHEFQSFRSADHVAEYWHAHCSCGWSGVYTHAAESYARHDWAWHVQQETA